MPTFSGGVSKGLNIINTFNQMDTRDARVKQLGTKQQDQLTEQDKTNKEQKVAALRQSLGDIKDPQAQADFINNTLAPAFEDAYDIRLPHFKNMNKDAIKLFDNIKDAKQRLDAGADPQAISAEINSLQRSALLNPAISADVKRGLDLDKAKAEKDKEAGNQQASAFVSNYMSNLNGLSDEEKTAGMQQIQQLRDDGFGEGVATGIERAGKERKLYEPKRLTKEQHIVAVGEEIARKRGIPVTEGIAEAQKPFEKQKTPTKMAVVATALGFDIHSLTPDQAVAVLEKLQSMSKASWGNFAQKLQSFTAKPGWKDKAFGFIQRFFNKGEEESGEAPESPNTNGAFNNAF